MADSSTATRSKKKKSSHKSKKKTDEAPKELPPPQEAEDPPPKADTPTRSTSSPDPNCAICLEKLENKSFTDSCFHMFCFLCLLEWSKVKNECPLCKQSFKSIIHNVRSYDDYDQYHLSLYRSNHSPEHQYSRNFRYRTTLTQDRILNLRNRVIGNPATDPAAVSQLQSIGAPRNSLRASDLNTRQDWRRRRQAATSEFRRRIYTNGMRLTGVRGTNGRARDISPAFFTANPALTHRLVPWLNRELNALLYNQESHVQFVLELIMGLIKRFEIHSEEFYQHIFPFIGRHTRHFIHEFEMFSKSPYCMIVYYKKCIYEQQAESVSSDADTVNSISDDDSDVQIISTEAAPAGPSREFLNLPDISAEVQVHSLNLWNDSNFLSSASWHSPTPGPSWHFEEIPPEPRIKNFIPSLGRSVGLNEADEIDSSSDSVSTAGSDVQIVAYDKPWEDRSPINLSSDSEGEAPREKVKSKKKERKSKKQKPKKSGSSIETSETAHPLTAVSSAEQQPETSVAMSVDTSERLLGQEEPSTSQGRRSKHKSKSRRDSHYHRRMNTLFHRRSTSPEMLDDELGEDSYFAKESEVVHPLRLSRSTKRKHHDQEAANPDEGTPQYRIISSDSEKAKKHKKKNRRQSRSPSVEIIGVHHKERSKRKHKKHKHKHKHSHKHHRSHSDAMVSEEATNIPGSVAGTVVNESVTTPEALSQGSSCTTTSSEATSSTRSFACTDAFPSICETLTPVEIASSIAKRSTNAVENYVTTTDDVLDLTAVNPDELDEDILDVVSTIDAVDSLSANNLSAPCTEDHGSSKSYKKHPSGHKSSQMTRISDTSASNFNSLTVPDVMMHGDPLFSHGSGSRMFPSFMDSFRSAFSAYNPAASWYRPTYFNSACFGNNAINLGGRSSLATQSIPPRSAVTSSNYDSAPLDLRQVQPADSTKTTTQCLNQSSSAKSSTEEDTDVEMGSSIVDVTSFDKNDTEPQTSKIDDVPINVIDVSPSAIDISDSEPMVNSSVDTSDKQLSSSKKNMHHLDTCDASDGHRLTKDSDEYSDAETDIYKLDNSQSDIDVESTDLLSDDDCKIIPSSSTTCATDILENLEHDHNTLKPSASSMRNNILLAKNPVLSRNGMSQILCNSDQSCSTSNLKTPLNTCIPSASKYSNDCVLNNISLYPNYFKQSTTVPLSHFRDCSLPLPIYTESPSVSSSVIDTENTFIDVVSNTDSSSNVCSSEDVKNSKSHEQYNSVDSIISDQVTSSELQTTTVDDSYVSENCGTSELQSGGHKSTPSELQPLDKPLLFSVSSELQNQIPELQNDGSTLENSNATALHFSNFTLQSELQISDSSSSNKDFIYAGDESKSPLVTHPNNETLINDLLAQDNDLLNNDLVDPDSGMHNESSDVVDGDNELPSESIDFTAQNNDLLSSDSVQSTLQQESERSAQNSDLLNNDFQKPDSVLHESVQSALEQQSENSAQNNDLLNNDLLKPDSILQNNELNVKNWETQVTCTNSVSYLDSTTSGVTNSVVQPTSLNLTSYPFQSNLDGTQPGVFAQEATSTNSFSVSNINDLCDVSQSTASMNEVSNSDLARPSTETTERRYPIFWKKKVVSLIDSTWREESSSEDKTETESESDDDESDEMDQV